MNADELIRNRTADSIIFVISVDKSTPKVDLELSIVSKKVSGYADGLLNKDPTGGLQTRFLVETGGGDYDTLRFSAMLKGATNDSSIQGQLVPTNLSNGDVFLLTAAKPLKLGIEKLQVYVSRPGNATVTLPAITNPTGTSGASGIELKVDIVWP